MGRLQSMVEASQEMGEFEAGNLEGELLERTRECSALRREAEDSRRRIEDMLKLQKDCQEAAEAGRTLRTENDGLKSELEAKKQETQTLNDCVERCLQKMEKDGQERPHLVDKRMVTQMVAAYLEQRDFPRQQLEVLTRMADLLGFTAEERHQVGLTHKKRSILEQEEEPTGLAELSDRFVDFLLEETEGGD